jgi:hypothetical protein
VFHPAGSSSPSRNILRADADTGGCWISGKFQIDFVGALKDFGIVHFESAAARNQGAGKMNPGADTLFVSAGIVNRIAGTYE